MRIIRPLPLRLPVQRTRSPSNSTLLSRCSGRARARAQGLWERLRSLKALTLDACPHYPVHMSENEPMYSLDVWDHERRRMSVALRQIADAVDAMPIAQIADAMHPLRSCGRVVSCGVASVPEADWAAVDGRVAVAC